MPRLRTAGKELAVQAGTSKRLTTPPIGNVYQVALDTLEEARALQQRINEQEATINTLGERIRNGSRWLLNNRSEHPRYDGNRELLNRLRWEHQQKRYRLRDARLAFLQAAWAFHLAHDQLTELERLAVDFDDEFERPDPEQIYALVTNWHLEATS